MTTHRKSRLTALGTIAAWTVIVGIGAILAAAVVVPRLGGGTPYVILTGSMRPGMPPGTLVVTRPVNPTTLGVGQVITYQLVSGEPTVVTHRIVAQGVNAVGQPIFHTRGDANTATDPGWVRPVQIRGARWYSIPYLGYLTSVVTSAQRQVLLDLVVAGLFGYALLMFAGDLRGRRALSR